MQKERLSIIGALLIFVLITGMFAFSFFRFYELWTTGNAGPIAFLFCFASYSGISFFGRGSIAGMINLKNTFK